MTVLKEKGKESIKYMWQKKRNLLPQRNLNLFWVRKMHTAPGMFRIGCMHLGNIGYNKRQTIDKPLA
jgi:hypothetical protein